MTGTIVVCADDFALSSSVSDAIVDLAERGRISAISCMVTSPLWQAHAQRLKPLIGRVDIGLHLVLIEEAPLTAPDTRLPSLARLIVDSYLGRVDLRAISAEIDAQVAAFQSALGVTPSHLDGHRHTHVLPGIRDIVLQKAASISPRPWLRNIAEPWRNILARGVAVPKTLLLSALGRSFAHAARQQGLAMNDTFSGVYSLGPAENFPALFERFLLRAGTRHVIMCHPGMPGDGTTMLAVTRAKEYAYLRDRKKGSDSNFCQDCVRHSAVPEIRI